jgi:hypothetical protein
MDDPPSTVPSPGQSSGSNELFFDPDAFSVTVAGMARAADQIGSAERQVDHAAGSADAFGAVSAAWSAFHQAWSARVKVATSAADQLTSLLPVAAHAYESADAHGGSGSIESTSIWSDGPDGVGQDLSEHTSATVLHLPGKT